MWNLSWLFNHNPDHMAGNNMLHLFKIVANVVVKFRIPLSRTTNSQILTGFIFRAFHFLSALIKSGDAH